MKNEIKEHIRYIYKVYLSKSKSAYDKELLDLISDYFINYICK